MNLLKELDEQFGQIFSVTDKPAEQLSTLPVCDTCGEQSELVEGLCGGCRQIYLARND